MTDMHIAQALGISRQAVYMKRKSLKVAACTERGPRMDRLHPDAIPLRATCSDAALAARFGVPADLVYMARRARQIPVAQHHTPMPPGLVEALGTASDRELGLWFSWHYSKVRTLRLEQRVACLQAAEAQSRDLKLSLAICVVLDRRPRE